MMNHSVALVRQLRSTLAKFHHTRWRALMKQRDSSEDTLAREKHEYDKFLKESELNDEEIGKSALKSAPWLMLGVFGAAKIASDVYGKYSTRRKEYERVEKAEELLKVHEKELQLLEATTKKIDDQANAIGEKMWCYAGWWGFVVNDWEQFNRAFLCFNQTVRAAAGDSSRKQAFQTLDAKKLKKMEHTWLGGPEKLAEILRKQQQAKEEVFAENPTSFAEHEIDDQSVSIDETIDFEEVQAAKAGKKTLEEAIGSHLLHLQRQLYMLVETAERFYLNRTKVR
ncbi:unnamed protein product [Amoebophrya sp. A120]|nr:unnamed protein product [Amoebophrya sp. A120]|eukprot:GSA120T00020183001.1